VSAQELERRVLDESRGRVRVVVVALALFLGALLIRAGVVMTMPDERLARLDQIQFRSAVELQGQRGPLLDRNGRVLAWTVELPSLYADPSRFPAHELDRRVPEIAALVGRDEAWVRARLTKPKAREVKLGDALDPEKVAAVRVGLGRDQLWTRNEPVRYYPGRELGAPLLGYVANDGSGAAGLEKVLERELAGQTYRILRVRDRKDRAVEAGADGARLAQAGHGVRLTLDAAIQHATERALQNAMIASAPDAAMAVVMDVRTGAILALATTPAGNANDGEARAQQELFKNRPAMDQLEPGSVMKPFVAAAAIEEGLVAAEDTIDCELGSWVVGDKTIRDDHPKGVITVTEVIKYSSNIGAAKLGFKLGAGRTLGYLKQFGFGRSTGLGLPGEVAGMMRSPNNIRPIELATTSFGQGVTASAIQLASAVATLANGGVRMQPRLVDAILDRFGQEESVREPRVDRRVVSEETARTVTLMMETVTEEHGTGTRARVPGYRVAGKTGTAQKVEGNGYSPTKRVSSYVGFLPADRPEIAVAVVVDNPTKGSKYGGIVAAPVFAEVGAFAMEYLGVPPDPTPPPTAEDGAPLLVAVAPAAEPAPAATRDPLVLTADGTGGWVLPDLTGRSVRAAVGALAPGGLQVAVEGEGRLVAQNPPAGAAVLPGTTVSLRFDSLFPISIP